MTSVQPIEPHYLSHKASPEILYCVREELRLMKDKDPILHSLEIIESQICEKLTVEYIARGVHFSKFHYQRLFRADELGQHGSPIRFLATEIKRLAKHAMNFYPNTQTIKRD